MLKSTEAVIAGMLVLSVIIALFQVPGIKTNDPIESYLNSVLEAYQDTIETLITTNPYSLRILISSVIPLGYSSRIQINYFTKLKSRTGTSEDVPYETYMMLPTEAKFSLGDYGVESNWFHSVFTIENSGSKDLENQTMDLTISLILPDLNSDGIVEPVDLASIQVFTQDGKVPSELKTYEFKGDRFVVNLEVEVGGIIAKETKLLYVYYLVGDDYE